MTYNGETLNDVVNNVTVNENSVGNVAILNLKNILQKRKENTCYLYALAYDEKGNALCQETLPLTDENTVKLPKVILSYDLSLDNDTVKLDIKSSDYARFVEIRLKGYSTMLSDNYFDMLPNQTKTVCFKLPNGEDLESIKQRITMRSLCDVERKRSAVQDRLEKAIIFWNPINLANYIARTFDK